MYLRLVCFCCEDLIVCFVFVIECMSFFVNKIYKLGFVSDKAMSENRFLEEINSCFVL